MKRRYFSASLLSDAGTLIATGRTRYAMNSAIQEAEALVRALAREEGTIYSGQRPTRIGDVYTRRWMSKTGRVVEARAWQSSS